MIGFKFHQSDKMLIALLLVALVAGVYQDLSMAPAFARKKSRTRSSKAKKKKKPKKKIVKKPEKLPEGDKLFEKRKYVKAEKAYSEYIEGFPKDYLGYLKRAKTWIKLRNNAPAFYDLNKAINLEPKKSELYFERGALQVARGEFESALKDLAIALKKGYEDKIAVYKLRSEAYYNIGLHKKEVEEIGKIMEVEQNEKLYRQRAQAYYIMRDYKEAIGDYSKALETSPDSYKLLLRRGYCNELIKQYPEAIADYSKIIDKDPRAYSVFYRRAQVHLASGQNKKALSDINKAIFHFRGYNPKNYYKLRAKIYSSLGENQKAAKDKARYARKRRKKRR